MLSVIKLVNYLPAKPPLMQISKQHTKQGWLFFNSELWSEVNSAYFEPRYWQQNRAVIGQATGRGKALFFRHLDRICVLRHYHRGGLVAKFSRDRYLFTGLRTSRVWREFKLLMELQARQLPAPVPLAGRLVKVGLSFRADIILERIDGAEDLGELLSKQRLSLESWQAIGQCIARFHKAGVYHADLNLRNIMLDQQGQVWLIDFDNGRLRRPRKKWQQENIARLLRSLEKAQAQPGYCHWLESDWQTMLAAYQQAMQN